MFRLCSETNDAYRLFLGGFDNPEPESMYFCNTKSDRKTKSSLGSSREA